MKSTFKEQFETLKSSTDFYANIPKLPKPDDSTLLKCPKCGKLLEFREKLNGPFIGGPEYRYGYVQYCNICHIELKG